MRPALTKMFCVVQEIYRHAPNLLYADVDLPGDHLGRVDRRHLHPVGAPRLRVRRRLGGPRREGQRPHRGASRHGPGARQVQVDRAASSASMPTRSCPTRRRSRTRTARRSTTPRRYSRTSSTRRKGSDADLTGMLEVQRARRYRALRPAAPAARHPVAGRDLRCRQSRWYQAPLHAPGRLEEPALRATSVTPTARRASSCASRTTARTTRSSKRSPRSSRSTVPSQGRGTVALSKPGAADQGARQRPGAGAAGYRVLRRQVQEARRRRRPRTSSRSGSASGSSTSTSTPPRPSAAQPP